MKCGEEKGVVDVSFDRDYMISRDFATKKCIREISP
jgi:hypothetical protein